MNRQFKLFSVLIFSSAFFFAAPSFAVTNLTINDLSTQTADGVDSMIKTTAIGLDHHAFQPADPLGLFLGFDVSLEITGVSVPASFVDAVVAATGQQPPSVIPIPKLNVHKGLPFNIDVGASFANAQDSNGNTVFKSFGADVKYAFFTPVLLPPLAARFSLSYNTLYFLSTHTYSFDVLTSYSLLILDPYAGAGLQFWGGNLNIPTGNSSLPSNISASTSGVSPRFFVGAEFKLLIVRLAVEGDFSTTGVNTYGFRAGIGF
jgi:hypothetical protein